LAKWTIADFPQRCSQFVTAADIRTEKLLQARTGKGASGLWLPLEEAASFKEKTLLALDHRPLDGTSNFSTPFLFLCTIALETQCTGKKKSSPGLFRSHPYDLFTAEKAKAHS